MKHTRIESAKVKCFCSCNARITVYVEDILAEDLEEEIDGLAKDEEWYDHCTCTNCHEAEQQILGAEFLRDMAMEDSL